MNLAMFVTIGLTPVSTPTAGALVKLNPTVFLLVTGALAAALSLLAALNFLVREKDMSEQQPSRPTMSRGPTIPMKRSGAPCECLGMLLGVKEEKKPGTR